MDTGARKDIPSDILQRFNVHYPICIVPDGNRFCRSISHLVYGSEHHHVEMTCRIVIDSVLNLNNYTDHDYLMRCANHEHKNCSNIAEYYCCYSGVKSYRNRDQSLKGIKSVFREDVLRICKLKNIAVHGSSILQPMFYPQKFLWSSIQGIFGLMLEQITTAYFVPVKMTKQKSLVFCGQVFAQTTETNITILYPL